VGVHTFHLARAGVVETLRSLWRPPAFDGLLQVECMAPMQLGAPILSPWRWQGGQLAMFAAWSDQAAVDRFLASHPLGRILADGWHVRLAFLRRWGHVSALDGLPETAGETDLDAPVVAVTLARLRLTQVPRFTRWGKPVERLVRDDPASVFALAAARPPRTISTFTVWSSAREMIRMVQGRGRLPDPARHSAAMAERERKDFHLEFTTLRFTCISEHGRWNGRDAIVPRA